VAVARHVTRAVLRRIAASCSHVPTVNGRECNGAASQNWAIVTEADHTSPRESRAPSRRRRATFDNATGTASWMHSILRTLRTHAHTRAPNRSRVPWYEREPARSFYAMHSHRRQRCAAHSAV
jgi:hypothetical protein